MIGKRVGKLVVLSEIRKYGRPYGSCICDCGRRVDVRLQRLVSGATLSCGCLRVDVAKRNRTHGESVGTGNTAEYRVWTDMKKRCYNPRFRFYGAYGGRGISVCDKWRLSYEAFLADLGRKPTPRHSLDRIDNDGNYEPGNVRWATKSEQAKNRRSTRWITHDGFTGTMKEWAQRIGLTSGALLYRLRHMPLERALVR